MLVEEPPTAWPSAGEHGRRVAEAVGPVRPVRCSARRPRGPQGVEPRQQVACGGAWACWRERGAGRAREHRVELPSWHAPEAVQRRAADAAAFRGLAAVPPAPTSFARVIYPGRARVEAPWLRVPGVVGDLETALLALPDSKSIIARAARAGGRA